METHSGGKMIVILFIFMVITLDASFKEQIQKLPTIYQLLRHADKEEYNCLHYACKTIKQQQVIISDKRMRLADAIETAITMYLQSVDTVAARVLLNDLRKNGFNV